MRTHLLFLMCFCAPFILFAQKPIAKKTATLGLQALEMPHGIIDFNTKHFLSYSRSAFGKKAKNWIINYTKGQELTKTEIGSPFKNTFGFDFVSFNDRYFRFMLTKDKACMVASFLGYYQKHFSEALDFFLTLISVTRWTIDTNQ